MKKQFDQMAAENMVASKCWMAEFCRSPRKSVRLEKQSVAAAVGRDAVS